MLKITLQTILGTACLIVLTAAIVWAAKPGRCLLEVDGTKYINGRCTVELQKGGSFQIYDLKKRGYFAYVTLTDAVGVANGYWNGTDRGSHAHDPLGELTRDGACWVNDRARVCAWR